MMKAMLTMKAAYGADDEESDDDDDSDDKDKKEGFFRGLLGKNMKDKTELEDEVRKPKDSNKQKTGLAPNPQLANNENDPLSMPSKTKEGSYIKLSLFL